MLLPCGGRLGSRAGGNEPDARLRRQHGDPLLRALRRVGNHGLFAVLWGRAMGLTRRLRGDQELLAGALRRDEHRQQVRQRCGGVPQVLEHGRVGEREVQLLEGRVQWARRCRLIVECRKEPGWLEGVVGQTEVKRCSQGSVRVHCNEVGPLGAGGWTTACARRTAVGRGAAGDDAGADLRERRHAASHLPSRTASGRRRWTSTAAARRRAFGTRRRRASTRARAAATASCCACAGWTATGRRRTTAPRAVGAAAGREA